MIILVNTHSAGGTAEKKWERIEKEITRSNHCTVCMLHDHDTAQNAISDALSRGETDFASAGGDGTLNALLNHVIATAPDWTDRIRLGAIGLGSSNDFHKPVQTAQLINGISCKLDFPQARLRDIGSITIHENGTTNTKYFIINASCGVTAEGNLFFNNPDRTLRFLKRRFTPGAILYAAFRTIFKHRNIDATISFADVWDRPAKLTNLAVLKNTHFSGSLRYDTPIDADSGSFVVNTCFDMNRFEVMRLFSWLSRGRFRGLDGAESWTTPRLSVQADTRFSVEYDGEVLSAKSVTFDILPQLLQVCP